MNFVDYVLIAVLAAIIVAVVAYIIKSKKQGKKCIGCPSGGSCSACGCGCGKER